MRPSPRWWVILWSVWGLIVAGLILLLDQQPLLAMPWALVGGIVGLFGLKVVRPFATPLLEWYRGRNPDRGLQHRIFQLICDGETDTEEFKCYMAEERFWMCLPLPPLAGLFHGVVFGPAVGALCGIDDESAVSACAGAAIGLLLGPVLVAFLAGLTLACIVDLNRRLPFLARLARRGPSVVSPLLFVPAIWHCMWRVFRSV